MKQLLVALIAATMAFGAVAEQKKAEEKKTPPVAEKKAEEKKTPPVAEKKAEEKKNIGPRNRQTKKEQEKGDTTRLDANKK